MSRTSRRKKATTPPPSPTARPSTPTLSVRPESPRTITLLSLALLAATLLVYACALRGGFLWDDDGFLTENPLVHAADGFLRLWYDANQPEYLPVASTSFWLEWRLWGLNPAGYHVTNVLLHALGSVLLWRVLRRLAIPGAWAAALLFALHPVGVSTVAWIAERKSVLCLCFFLATFLFYFRFEDTRRARWYALAVAAFLLSLLSKTADVTLPLVLLLCAWYRRGRVTRDDVTRTLPFFALSLVLGLVTVWFQVHKGIGHAYVPDLSIPARLGLAGDAFWFYLAKDFFPVHLSPIYPLWQIDPASVISYLPTAGMLALVAVLWLKRKTWGRGPLFAVGYFLLMILPVMGFVKLAFWMHSLVADHFQYLALIGPVSWAVATAATLAARNPGPNPRRLAVGMGTVAISACAVLSFLRARIYADPQALWTDTIHKNSHAWVAYNNLGKLLYEHHQPRDAADQFALAACVGPRYAKPHFNLGKAYADLGRPDDALAEYRLALNLEPDLTEAAYNAGNLLLRAGRYADAIPFYQQAAADPYDARPHYNLGIAATRLQNFPLAADEFRQATLLDPTNPYAFAGLGSALLRLNDAANARAALQESLHLNPNQPNVQAQLEQAGQSSPPPPF